MPSSLANIALTLALTTTLLLPGAFAGLPHAAKNENDGIQAMHSSMAAAVMGASAGKGVDDRALQKNPEQVVGLVSSTFELLVAQHPQGLSDPKTSLTQAAAPLGAAEAAYHYQHVSEGVVDSARFLITFGILPALASNVQSRLARALMQDNFTMLEELLHSGADPNERSVDFGATPLHFASALGKKDAARLLVKYGAEARNIRSRDGCPPLHWASAMNQVELVKVLVTEADADIDARHGFANSTALHFAAEMGHVDTISMLCALRADGNAATLVGGTPLHTAADSDRPAAVAVLIEQCGSNPNALLNQDTTPLYLAAQRNHVEVIRTLVERGADLNQIMPSATGKGSRNTGSSSKDVSATTKDSVPYDYHLKNSEVGNGATALHAAAENGHLEAVRVLLELGAKQLSSMRGTSPLVSALQYYHPAIALALLEHGNFTGINDQTEKDRVFALYVAAGAGYLNVVQKMLLRSDIDVDLVTASGASSLAHALHRKHCDVAEVLLQHKAHVDSTSIEAAGNCPSLDLMPKASKHALGELLVTTKDTKRAQELVDLGADINHVSDSSGGGNLLHHAAQAGALDLVQFALTHGANINARASKNMYSASALYLACYEGHTEVAALLLSQPGIDAELGIETADGRGPIPPLVVAVEKGRDAIVEQLLLKSKSSAPRALVVAAIMDRKALVDRLLPEVTLHAKEQAMLECLAKSTKLTALPSLLATAMPQSGGVDFIVGALSRVLVRQREEATALPHATALDAVQKLIAKLPSGATLTPSKPQVVSPLIAAVITYSTNSNAKRAEADALDFVKALVPYIKDQAPAPKSKLTPMHLSVEMKRMRITKALMRAPGARESFNVESAQGETIEDVSIRLGIRLADEMEKAEL